MNYKVFKWFLYISVAFFIFSCSKEEDIIDDDSNIIIPTRLTPDGDGIDDYWEVKDPKNLINNNYFNAKIFDSEQKIVFNSNDKTAAWLGNNPNGTPSNAGNYNFLVRYKTWNGTDKLRTGTIQLIRSK
jgi:gliding motility-associated-like protein